MTGYLRQFDQVLWSVALLLPVAMAVTVGFARHRTRRGLPARRAWCQSVAEVAMVVGTLPWLVMGLWPVELADGAQRWRLVPLADLATLVAGASGAAFAQIVANLLVFFALGAGAPVRFPALTGLTRLFALGAVASLALEVSQQVFGTGRVFSVDDILLNGLGCLLGGLASRRWWLEPAPRT